MPNLEQKKKLANVLNKIGGSSDVDYELVHGVLEEINRLEKKIPDSVDLSPLLEEIRGLVRKTASHSTALSNIGDEITKLKKSIDEKPNDVSDSVKKDIENLRKSVQAMLSKSHGGGAMSRQLSTNGTVIATRYKDLNLIGSGITFSAANNDTTKQTDLTITATAAGLTRITISGTVNGSNQSFTSIGTLPTWLVIDGAWYEQKDHNNVVQWSAVGLVITTTITPSNSIWGF